MHNQDNNNFNYDAEIGVLSCLFKYGQEANIDVSDIISESSFLDPTNRTVFRIVKNHLEENENIDLVTFLSKASSCGYREHFDNPEYKSRLKMVLNNNVNKESCRQLAAQLKKLEITRLYRGELQNIDGSLSRVTGEESLSSIVDLVESPIFNISISLDKDSEGPKLIFKDIEEYVDFLENNPVDQIGLSTGYRAYDLAIGGGLRKKTVNVIGARPKIGKSGLADNIALHNLKNGVSTLMLDSELSEQDHKHRILAMLSNVPINEIETGAYSSSSDKKKRIRNAASLLKDLPYSYLNIAGKPFEDTISKMRRWRVKNVSEHNPGLIILDYIKMMDSSGISKNISEFQALGFMMTSLHNFTIKYDIPCLAFIQLNRDGINREDTDVASGSDRIIWLCSNFSIFKSQSEEEIQLQPANNRFNRKLVPIVQRHGGGLEDGDFINMRFIRNICKIEEGPTRNEMVDTASQQGELTNDDESEIF